VSTFFLDKNEIRLYYGHKSAGVNPIGYLPTPPLTPLRILFSHIDNYPATKSRAVLLAYAGVPRWPMRAPAHGNIFVCLWCTVANDHRRPVPINHI